jgi:Flp pilus assembly protein TadD
MDAGNWQTRRNLALALLDANRPAEAIAQAQKVVVLRPDDGVTHALLGQALARTGRRDEAVIEFRRALQLDPTDADTREWLSRLGVR